MSSADAFVFFGASGDLAYKKVFPALYRLVASHRLSVPIIGVAISEWDDQRLIERAHQSIQHALGEVDRGVFGRLAALLSYHRGDYNETSTFRKLRRAIGSAERPLYYMAIPPSLFGPVVQALRHTGCTRDGRLVIEKPFGRDLSSAQELNRTLLDVFPEHSIYRIDHYLGKEPVENLSYFRFANGIFESMWNRHYIDSVQITMAEQHGVQGRGAFYEEAGAIRDVLQNHLMQVVATLAMDSPSRGESPREARARLIRSIVPLRREQVVRGQFRGYREEAGVATDSDVETFCAVELHIDDSRWAGVPFFLRTGKRLPVTATEARVVFRRPSRPALGEVVPPGATFLRCRLGPDETIAMGLRIKRPGTEMVGRPVELVAHSDPAKDMLPYERLLGDALTGHEDLFALDSGVEAAWRVVNDVLAEPPPLHQYEPGSWGPEAAEQVIDGHGPWHDPADSGAASDGGAGDGS